MPPRGNREHPNGYYARELTFDQNKAQGAVLVEEPMASLYEVTRLRNIRSNKSKTTHVANYSASELDDFITRGVIGEHEAEELYAIFHTSLNHYFLKSVRSSELLTATILTVTALHIPTSAETFDKCYKEVLSLISSSMFSRCHAIDNMRGLCIAALRLSDGKLAAFEVDEMLEKLMKFKATREHERFLQLPFANALDYRILSQAHLMQILTRIHDRFAERGPPQEDRSGAQLSEGDFVNMRNFNVKIDRWRMKLACLAASIFVIIFTITPTSRCLSTERKEFANTAISSAASILTFVLEEKDMRRAVFLKERVTSDRHPLYHVAAGLEKMFERNQQAQARRPPTVGGAAPLSNVSSNVNGDGWTSSSFSDADPRAIRSSDPPYSEQYWDCPSIAEWS
ncbi:hypothetical protein K469DRAFT_778265 [Zopfia rhizophila CBS 207.26]|uniref:Uncharacterized protein n=1 Tax=Zopfia rhizophila CBS 207.26 TaxID=1314779 RepID=A0A6A6E6H6_9PEZI|nr:hypothetical protein K469DRAFT_778265 [Zopfia rhizophila CBS 207.26]